jgi:ribosomal protein L1
VQTRSKRFLEIQKLRESKKEYDVPTAVSLMKQMASSKFVETAETHFRMNLDPKYNDQQLRATVHIIPTLLSLCSVSSSHSVAFIDLDLCWYC